jgi:hypothetical protein
MNYYSFIYSMIYYNQFWCEKSATWHSIYLCDHPVQYFNIFHIWLLLQGLFGVNEGYIYYICGFARYDISSVELIAQWNEVVQLSLKVSNELPPSTVSRGRPMPEALFSNWWSYNNLVSLLCLWTYSWRLWSNLFYDHILKKHGCPNWSMDNWPIRVDPCLKSIYNYIYFIIPLYDIITTIILSILNFP